MNAITILVGKWSLQLYWNTFIITFSENRYLINYWHMIFKKHQSTFKKKFNEGHSFNLAWISLCPLTTARPLPQMVYLFLVRVAQRVYLWHQCAIIDFRDWPTWRHLLIIHCHISPGELRRARFDLFVSCVSFFILVLILAYLKARLNFPAQTWKNI